MHTCPHCGKRLNDDVGTPDNQRDANSTKNSTGYIERSLMATCQKSLASNVMKNCLKWVILPFTKTKKIAPREINRLGFVGKLGNKPAAVAIKVNVPIQIMTLYRAFNASLERILSIFSQITVGVIQGYTESRCRGMAGAPRLMWLKAGT